MSWMTIMAGPRAEGFARSLRRAARKAGRSHRTTVFVNAGCDDADCQSRRAREAMEAWARGERVFVVSLDEAQSPRGLSDLAGGRWTLEGAPMAEIVERIRAAPAPERPAPKIEAGVSWMTLMRAIEKRRTEALAAGRPLRDHVFVSYARKDWPLVRPVVEAARARGIALWVDTRDLEAGAIWPGEIVDAIRRSRGAVVFCSEAAFASDHVFRELTLAAKFRKTIVPAYLDDAATPDAHMYFLSTHQRLDLRTPVGQPALLEALAKLGRGRSR